MSDKKTPRQDLAVEWNGHESFTVGITHFPYESFDSFRDDLLELIRQGKPIDHALRKWEHQNRVEWQKTALLYLVTDIIHSKKPKAVAFAYAFLSGIAEMADGDSVPEQAKKLKVSKQALFQLIENVRDRLGGTLRAPTERSDEAKDNMRKRNFRKTKLLA